MLSAGHAVLWRKSVLRPSHEANPNTSVSVVMKTDEASAGSIFIARSASGMSVPAVAATNMLMIIAAQRIEPEPEIALPGPDDQQPDHAAARRRCRGRRRLP